MPPPSSIRYPELDLLRSLAVLLMIVYHAAYDLSAFADADIDVFSGWWLILARSTAVLFLLIVGISFSISWHRSASYSKYLRRGVILIFLSMIVTVVTLIFDPSTYVRFGILHLIGISILLLPFFSRFGIINGLIGCMWIAIGLIIKNKTIGTSLLIPIGLTPSTFQTIDYFPLFPWFGVVLMGYAIGLVTYVRGPLGRNRSSNDNACLTILTFPGRYALLIYLAHQPVLTGIMKFVLYILRYSSGPRVEDAL